MTMTRETKKGHKVQLDTARYAPDHLTGTWWARPDRRGTKMTAAEYAQQWMGRKVDAEPRAHKMTKSGWTIVSDTTAYRVRRQLARR